MRVPAALAAAIAALAQVAVPAGALRASTVSPDVVREVRERGRLEVFVMLRDPGRVRPGDDWSRRRLVSSQRQRVLSSVDAAQLRVQRELALASGFTASVTPDGLEELLTNSEVRRVEPLARGSGALADSVPQIRADVVHRRDDLGQHVTVAVLDTGVDPSHPDLAGSVVAEECFCSAHCCPNGRTRQSGPGAAFTKFVHGVHVAGTIVSKGLVAPTGVAPAAQIVAVKVLDDDNSGSLVDWIAALEWIAQNRPDVQVINMSLQSDATFAGFCDGATGFTMAFAQNIGLLRSRGVLTFAAAGNGEKGIGAIDKMAAPACVRGAVAVGAVDKHDHLALFGNTDAALDLLAPGVGIVSASPGGDVQALTGTSMATPHATATAALMLAINPSLSADALERALQHTDTLIRNTRSGLSFPRVNALASMNAVLNLTSPVLGGGSKRSDCLVAWNVTPAGNASARPLPGAVCRDNDPACDADQTPGQCTFQVSLCFNLADRRLPYCDTSAPIVDADLAWPRATGGGAIDAMNAAAIRAALPPLPIEGVNHCTATIPFVVPTAPGGGKQWIRFWARAASGVDQLPGFAGEGDDGGSASLLTTAATRSDGERIDHDRLRFTCVP